jgi:hypothetical protein
VLISTSAIYLLLPMIANFSDKVLQTWEKTDKEKEGRGQKMKKDKERKITSKIKSAIRLS